MTPFYTIAFKHYNLDSGMVSCSLGFEERGYLLIKFHVLTSRGS